MFTIDATNLPRFMACNGSRLLAASMPLEAGDTTLRDEGNAAHYMALAVHRGEFTIEELIDRKAPNGVYMSSDMAEHVADYLSAIDRSSEPYGHMEVDTSFGADGWRVNARADHLAFDGYSLNIDDLKYGWRIVEPENNWTLIAHAIGYCLSRQITPSSITLTIHQPRPYHPDGTVRSVTMTYGLLVEYYQQIAAAMTNPSDTLNTGPQCNKCHALATCPAARKASMNAIDVADIAFNDDIDNAVLAYELDTLNRASTVIDNRLKALEELAKFRMKSGQVIDNYSLERQLANTTWKPGIDVDMLRVITGKDLSKPKPITPNQAMKLGVPESVIKSLTHRPETGMKLTRVSAHKRAERILGKRD